VYLDQVIGRGTGSRTGFLRINIRYLMMVEKREDLFVGTGFSTGKGIRNSPLRIQNRDADRSGGQKA
jgi:hypothetical protein